MYSQAVAAGAASWNEVEASFLAAMSAFDTDLAGTQGRSLSDSERTSLSGDIQNGKGDFFNDLLALLLENCAEIESLYTRSKVPGLIVREHNLDGVYPESGPIGFLLEAKMMGTPRHALSPRQKPTGRRGSADLGKRVKELAFKSIDLKGEHSRRMTSAGQLPSGGGPGGTDLTTWLRASPPNIYFFFAVRVLSDSDFDATIRWAHTAQQVVDAVGLYCYEPGDGTTTEYRRRRGVPTELELERVLYKACLELRSLAAEATT
ncbi:MAG: hypothetical protein GY788_22490 [bacterium]|nr:hypothetical protein [bacterium]